MIRMSVTWLDSYLLYRDEDWMSLETLLAQMRGEEPPNAKMEAGRAFHGILEDAKPGELSVVERDGWVFSFSFLESELALPPVRELKGTISIDTPSGPVTLVGKVDAIGSHVVDYKLTERWDADRYMDAMQWRAYLWMFQMKQFSYEVFVGDIDPDERRVRVKEHHPLPLFAYPEMWADVRGVVCDLADLIARRAPDLMLRTETS